MQTVLIYVLVAAAAFYIGRRAYRTITRKQHAGCEHCSASEVGSANHTKITPGK